jgi:hypothetical protein
MKYKFAFYTTGLQERRKPLIHRQLLLAKRVAFVPVNVTLYGRKGKRSPSLRCSVGHLK